MWLYLLGGVLLLVGLFGTAFGAGIFTIILIPIGLVIIASAMGYAMWGRAAQGAAGGNTQARPSTAAPLPHAAPSAGQNGQVANTPEALADARRVEQ
jgi:hypothetical protein